MPKNPKMMTNTDLKMKFSHEGHGHFNQSDLDKVKELSEEQDECTDALVKTVKYINFLEEMLLEYKNAEITADHVNESVKEIEDEEEGQAIYG